MALAVWRRQLPPHRTRVIFDCIGPSRVQAFLPGLCRSPYALYLHGIEVWRKLTWDRRQALRSATIRLANSSLTIDRAKEFLPWLPRTAVVPLALEDRSPGGEVDRALLESLGDGYLLIVGRMSRVERYKGHDELLAAMPRIVAACPHARLVIAGGGDDRERLTRVATSRGLAGRVAFTGFVSEATLGELFRRCAAFVMPSRNEGFGLVYLEAMRAGRPCLALRRSAAEEIIVDGTTGILVEPGDQEQLAAALVCLLSDAAMVRRMGEAGRRRYEERYTFESFRAGLLPHLDRLLGVEGNDVRN
ncbi:MAG: glycosyltransferase family 4 protein [Actinomycetota bacterium]|nr:glycosyltransferase family 4 protein [Actinomycetota bacterium]